MSTPKKTKGRKWLKVLGIILGSIVLILALLYFMYNENMPKGEKGPAAEALAQKMLGAIDHAAWDSTVYVQWTFKGIHSFVWDKKRHLVEVIDGENKVLLNTKQVSGKAWEGDQALTGEAADKAVQAAWGYFCNDSFWLNAPAKVFDPGTERSVVKLEDGREALLVSYTSGGVTPGDAYLWILDDQGQPESWKMWVNIIPLGGVSFTWEKWESITGGAKIATLHKSKLLELDISNLKAGQNYQAIGRSADPFAELN